MGTTTLMAALALVVVGATPPAAAVARGRIAPFVVALWVIGFAEVVAVSVALSLVSALTRAWLLIAFSALAAIALVVARRLEIRPPSLSHAVSVSREIAADRVLVVLALGALAAIGYAAVLALFTAPSEHDALTYHLIRAAYWKQEHGISWIHEPIDIRANASPIVAEVGVAATMILSRGDRFVALPQLSALIVCVLGVFGLSRAIGLDRRASAFGALCVAFLPVALVQSSTAMNDVVPAAFAVAVALFAMGRARLELVMVAIAIALMIGTKGSAFLVLPALVLIAALAQPRGRWPVFAAVGAVAAAAGSGWYVVTRREEGDATAGVASTLRADLTDPVAAIARFTRYLASTLEVPGVGRDQMLYVLIGALLAVVAILTRRRPVAVAGLVVVAVPLVVLARGAAEELYKRAWWKLARPDLVRLDDGDGNGTLVTAGYSWYGPVAVLLSLLVLVVVINETRARRIGRVAVAFALAPWLTIATLALVLVWAPVFGRIVMPGVMLGAAVWGYAYRVRWATIAATAASLVVALMSFWWFDVKQIGVRLLEPPRDESAWSKSRWELQDYEEGIAPFLAFADRTLPRSALVAVNRPGPAPYSAYGPELRRTLALVDGTTATVRGDWYLGPTGSYPPCRGSWTTVAGPESRYWMLRRVPGACRT